MALRHHQHQELNKTEHCSGPEVAWIGRVGRRREGVAVPWLGGAPYHPLRLEASHQGIGEVAAVLQKIEVGEVRHQVQEEEPYRLGREAGHHRPSEEARFGGHQEVHPHIEEEAHLH